MQAIMGLITTGWDGQITWPSSSAWPWVVLIGCAGLLAHTCVTNALAVAPAIVVTPMDFLRLPAIALIGRELNQRLLGLEPEADEMGSVA